MRFDSIFKRNRGHDSGKNLAHFAQQMISQRQHHLQAASDIEEKIRRIQNSTKVLWPLFSTAHNYLRMRFDWYYRWHMNKNCYLLHITILFIFVLAIIYTMINNFV